MDFLPFFLIMLATVLFSTTFRRFHLPWVLALIAAGVAIGPYGFEIVAINPTIEFMGEVGLIFLMFMAGLEVQLGSFKKLAREISILSALNGLIPLVVGVVIGILFGFDLLAALLLGVIFMSSSVAVIIPTLEANGVIHQKIGRLILSATVVVDVASLIFLSVLLQTVDPITALPLPSFYLLLLIILIAFRYGLPRIRRLFPRRRDEQDLFESEVRIIFAMLIGTVITFDLLGLHPIIAGFFTGLVLSDTITSDIILHKLHTISYGVFIPVFFAIVGMNTDIGVFFDGASALGLIVAIVIASIGAKYVSGYIGGKVLGFNTKQSALIGAATIPQLSTTLAVVYTAVEIGLLESTLVTAMVVLSIVTTVLAPLAVRRLTAA